MFDSYIHSYVDISLFPDFVENPAAPVAVALYSASIAAKYWSPSMSWVQTQRILDKIHCQKCGDSSYADIRTLLQRTYLWNDYEQRNLANAVQGCKHCLASSTPSPSRKVALGFLNCSFSDFVMTNNL